MLTKISIVDNAQFLAVEVEGAAVGGVDFQGNHVIFAHVWPQGGELLQPLVAAFMGQLQVVPFLTGLLYQRLCGEIPQVLDLQPQRTLGVLVAPVFGI